MNKDRRDILDDKNTMQKILALVQVCVESKEKESLIIYAWEWSLESNKTTYFTVRVKNGDFI